METHDDKSTVGQTTVVGETGGVPRRAFPRSSGSILFDRLHPLAYDILCG